MSPLEEIIGHLPELERKRLVRICDAMTRRVVIADGEAWVPVTDVIQALTEVGAVEALKREASV
ncbi:hypothetical protein [Pseudomonas sp. LRF_L74]|uniref:hypothetical protein n=1 Tax=Pseudomonas sp. LRF_L74 TaxID=3369422 RepID=UPI003F63ADDD